MRPFISNLTAITSGKYPDFVTNSSSGLYTLIRTHSFSNPYDCTQIVPIQKTLQLPFHVRNLQIGHIFGTFSHCETLPKEP